MGLVRLLLAISVFIVHSKPFFGLFAKDGVMPVEAFFILSGFYMGMVLKEKYTSPFTFYKNRALRLYPAYLLLLIVGVICTGIFNLGPSWSDLHPLTAFVLAFSNITMIGLDVLMLFGVRDGSLYLIHDARGFASTLSYFIIIPAWSLGVEIWFYILAPFLAKRKWPLLAGIMLLSIGARYVGAQYDLWREPWSYKYFPFELALFLAGVLSYRFYAFLRPLGTSKILGWGSLSALILAVLFPPPAVMYYIIIVLCMPLAFLLTKNWQWDRFIGDLTYPFYLLHWLLLSINKGILPSFVVLLIGLGLSALIVLFIERPLQRLRV